MIQVSDLFLWLVSMMDFLGIINLRNAFGRKLKKDIATFKMETSVLQKYLLALKISNQRYFKISLIIMAQELLS